ncbi:MAG: serine/threonine-protein phosphatase [Chloroflexia bacterium]|nr:serine/threonine-protein phosphatase [Chloroflexia bacterium]
MQFTVLNIILLSSTAIFIGVSIILFLKLKNRNRVAEKRINKLVGKFENEKLYFEKEIKRQNYILEEYKQKNGTKRTSMEHSPVLSTAENSEAINASVNIVTETKSRSFAEDMDFKEKNKKLWELSVAVHKEKERIDNLKNEIERRHEEVTKSITYAQRIQKALLPTSKILGVRFADYFILWKPRDIVSGDFYWLKRLENTTVIVAADCTGHGVPGAFMSLLGISFLNDIFTKTQDLKSFQILDRLREMIKLALQQDSGKKRKAGDGIDMGICIINHKTLEADFAGANNPMYLIRNEEVFVLKENRNPVGVHPFEKPFKNHEFTLQKGDRIYMFSDGFIDQFGGESGRKFLKKNFQRLLLHVSMQNLPMQKESEILEQTLDEWRGKQHPQIDDVLILGLKI